MFPLTINTSPNIASLDTEVLASLCSGKMYINVSPSVFIGSGALNVLGASIKVESPTGVIIKNYPTSGYDIYADSPAFASGIEVTIPTQANNFQYGTYLVTAQITDADGTVYTTDAKPVRICEPDKDHKTRNYGTLSAKIEGSCKAGKLFIDVATPPNYISTSAVSQENNLKVEYPTGSLIAPLENIALSSWSDQLYEGVWKLTGTVCAKYNFANNVSVEVLYKVSRTKDVKCIIDECCVLDKLVALHTGLSEKCSQEEKENLSSIASEALFLLKTAKLAATCGYDPSQYITELETLLGCKCTCNCNEGTPIINNAPAKDFSLIGCGFSKSTVGLTDIYEILNYSYEVGLNDNGGVLVKGDPELNGCTVVIPLTFNITPLYNQIAAIANNNPDTWAAVVNKSLIGIDPSCLGLNTTQWNSLTLKQKVEYIVASACEGGTCNASIDSLVTSNDGADVIFDWEYAFTVGVSETVQVFIDDILAGTTNAATFTFRAVGFADGNPHTYKVITKCSNGVTGQLLDGSFTYYGCPSISVPVVSLSSVSNADCPYDLTALVSALPSGIEAEWHNANNTNAASLVADPANAADGTYYVFAKNSDNCYSLGVKVILVCSVATNCSEPQNLLVEAIDGGFRVRFQSAAFAPPSNSYTVKRKLASDPDVDGSYTTIGAPTYNLTVNRWEILDATAVDNTLYTYKAISNCSASTPAILYDFASIDCPEITLVTLTDRVQYSFVPVGGAVTKYELEVWNKLGTTRLKLDTFNPAFSNPITGEVVYLEASTFYKVRVRVYIGSYSKLCDFQSVLTKAGTAEINNDTVGGSITQVYNINGFTLGSPVVGGYSDDGTYALLNNAAIGVAVTGVSPTFQLILYKDGDQIETIDLDAGDGTYTFATTVFNGEDILITLYNNA